MCEGGRWRRGKECVRVGDGGEIRTIHVGWNGRGVSDKDMLSAHIIIEGDGGERYTCTYLSLVQTWFTQRDDHSRR